MEPWKDRLARKVEPASMVEVTAGLEAQLIRGSDHHDHSALAPEPDVASANPHIWLDVQLAMHCVSNIISAMSAADSVHAAGYRANGAAYIERLRALDSEIAAGLRPFAGRAIMTYHDSLPYFARRYGIKIAAVVQPVPEVNPSPRRLSELRQLVREQEVKGLLVDPGSHNALAERIGKEFNIPLVRFDVLETGPLVPSAYEDGMRRNVSALIQALQ
jgi:zinc transport system substrate-binding protein